MIRRMDWLGSAGRFIIWVLVAASVSYVVAQRVSSNISNVDVTAPLPPIELSQRPTVGLTETSITSVVSANGTVISSDNGWVLEAPATSDELAYRLLDPPLAVKAAINGGPSGFTCAWIGLAQSGGVGGMVFAGSATELPEGTNPLSVTLRCQIPADVRVVSGMRGIMVLQMAKPQTVRALPVSAVVGSAGQGQVVVVGSNGTTELRTVQLGISDINNIEVTSGLDLSEIVLLNPTQFDLSQAAAES